MRIFLSRLVLFIAIPVLIFGIVIVAVPPTPRAQQSLLFAKIDKDRLLRDCPPPRLILVGGSNLSFGIDSQMIEEQTGYHTINTSIQATLGFKYMMDSTMPYIQPGDIVVLSNEYSQYFGKHMYGGEELLRTVLDVDRASIPELNWEQWLNIIRFIPDYVVSKINPRSYVIDQDADIGIYERDSFNQYGDAVIHWKYKHEDFSPYPAIEGELNREAFQLLREYWAAVESRGAKFYITFPGLQEATYDNMEPQIELVQRTLQEVGLPVLGSPKRYEMDELLMFNTPYHLNREGVVHRTQLLIDDLKSSGAVGSAP